MEQPTTLGRRPRAPTEQAEHAGQFWAVVLAGGEGMRLRPLTRRVCGDERPKQYAALVGSRSLLRQTLDRVGRVFPPERTVVVTLRSHAKYIAEEFRGCPAPRILVQPESRGTAAGVLLPAHWIQWRDSTATVAVFPSDHFILEEQAFMDHVLEVARVVGAQPKWIVLLGAQPTESETEYGWVEPGEPTDSTAGGCLFRIRRFLEKPPADTTRACLGAGCLWNTLVLVANVATLVEAGRQCLPRLHERLAGIAPFAGTADEPWAIGQAYALAPMANFSRTILESGLASLVVSKLPPLTWADLGTPERVLRTLQRIGISPRWMDKLDRPGEDRRTR